MKIKEDSKPVSSDERAAEISDTIPYSPAPLHTEGHGHDPTSHVVHSVVPDLMKVYESLTNGGRQQGAQEGHYPQAAEPPQPHIGYSETEYQSLQFDGPHPQNPNQESPNTLPYTSVPGNVNSYGDASDHPQASGSSGAVEETTPESAVPTSTSRQSSRKRGGSTTSESRSNSKSRKKNKETDGRWSKRFTWPDDLHRDFVSAIFDVGLKHSSPSTILEHMPKHEQITNERVKSHLQKYRIHRVKSKKEFMSSYDESLAKQKIHGLDGSKSLSGGTVAAHLSHSVLTNVDASTSHSSTPKEPPTVSGTSAATKPAPPARSQAQSEALLLPKLTEAEKNSPIGASLGYMLGLFLSLKKQLYAERASATVGAAVGDVKSPPTENAPSNGAVTDVYDLFAGGATAPTTATIAPDSWVTATGALQAPISEPIPSASLKATSGAAPVDQGSNQAPTGSVGSVKSVPSTVTTTSARNNLETSNMMKREMKSQMAFQTKMRALKQQELDKYKATAASIPSKPPAQTSYKSVVSFKDNLEGKANFHGDQGEPPKDVSAEGHVNDFQGAGETAVGVSARTRLPSIAIGDSDDFWNTDVVDEQLFEFLMNN